MKIDGESGMKVIEKLFFNGKIYTLEKEGVIVEALGVAGGKIIFAGTKQQAEAEYDIKEKVDLQGKTMLPGMGDSHLHFYAYCQFSTTVDLGSVTSKAEAIRKLAEKAAETPEGQWIKGSGFDQSKWTDCEDELPTREDLDKASTKHPIVIKRVCVHTSVANTMALEKAGIGKGYVFGEGGMVELDQDGMPNGILREQAPRIYDELIPDSLEDAALKKSIMTKALQEASANGLTMLHTYAADIWKYIERPEDYEMLDREGLLPLRVTICLDTLFDPPQMTEEQKADPNRKVQMGSYKIFTDGSLGSRSAALYEPYEDAPDSCGIMVIEQDALNEKMLTAYEKGLQPAIHCIGDRGLGATLTAIEYTLEQSRRNGMTEEEQAKRKPFRIIHVQMANEELINRMKKLPVILDIQPSFLMTDLHWIEERIGSDRAKDSYLWQRYLDEGFIQAGGSDCPVESFNPFQGIYAAVTRKDANRYPEEGYHPDQKVSVYDAVCMFSKNIPYATGEQDYMGTLEVGKFADLIVTDQNPFEVPENDLLDIKVVKTYLAGKEVYSQ